MSIPPTAKHHHSQFLQMPPSLTQPVTTSGVSAANEVAIMEVPTTHQGSLRPARKKESVSPLARLRMKKPTPMAKVTYRPMIKKSMVLNSMVFICMTGVYNLPEFFGRGLLPFNIRGSVRACRGERGSFRASLVMIGVATAESSRSHRLGRFGTIECGNNRVYLYFTYKF